MYGCGVWGSRVLGCGGLGLMALKFIKTSCQLVDAKSWLHNQAGSDFGLRAVGPD